MDYKPFSLFQSDFNLTKDSQPEMLNNFFSQLDNTSTNAIAYLTIYPMEGFDAVTDEAIAQLSQKVAFEINAGRQIFIRYASEMNGNQMWFKSGSNTKRKLVDL